MSKFTILGLLSWLGSLVLLGFQAIFTFMDPSASSLTTKTVWKKISVVDIIDTKYFDWINSIPWVSIKESANYVITMPLFILLFCVGLLFFITNAFMPKK